MFLEVEAFHRDSIIYIIYTRFIVKMAKIIVATVKDGREVYIPLEIGENPKGLFLPIETHIGWCDYPGTLLFVLSPLEKSGLKKSLDSGYVLKLPFIPQAILTRDGLIYIGGLLSLSPTLERVVSYLREINDFGYKSNLLEIINNGKPIE